MGTCAILRVKFKRRYLWPVCMLILFITVAVVYRMTNTELDISVVTNPRTYPTKGIGRNITEAKQLEYSTFMNSGCNQTYDAILSVNSAIRNFKKRQLIRDTLGRACVQLNCKVIFMLGAISNKHIMEKVAEEFESEHDVIVSWKEDTYNTVTNKVVTLLKWAVHRCPTAKYVIRINDDVYVNIKSFLSDLERVGGVNCKCFYCFVINDAFVRRSKDNKWFVSTDAYRSTEDRYPQYCAGAAHAFPNAISPMLLSAVFKAPYVWHEDVWLTGLLRLYANVSLQRTRRYAWIHEKGTFNPCFIIDYLFVHNVNTSVFNNTHNTFMHNLNGTSSRCKRFNYIYILPSFSAIMFVLLICYVRRKRQGCS